MSRDDDPQDALPLRERLTRPGPKRMLALDGGGIRGLITIGFLRRIEAELRARHDRPDLVLADYFDLIGGTSTGAIMAGALALGYSAERIHELYLSLGTDAFRPRKTWLGALGRMLGAKFDEKPLEEILRQHAGERSLDSPDLRCGLMVVVKRADTGSVWPVVNIPTQRYFESNRHIKLWELACASAAAPTYFKPRYLEDVGAGEHAVFVDGGVSMHNAPALQLLMAATLEGFGLRWPLGEENLLLVSVGTGRFDLLGSAEKMREYHNLQWAQSLTMQMVRDAMELDETLLQWMSRSRTPWTIDSQIGALENDLLGPQPLLTYLRYDIDLDRPGLAALGFSYDDAHIEQLRDISGVAGMQDLDEVGRRAAEAQVRADHFPTAFDLSP